MSQLIFSGKDDLSGVDHTLWQRLQNARNEGGDPLLTPALATLGAHYPQQRSVVLRKVDENERSLYFFTDARSEKVTELRANPNAALHFYHHPEKLQLRFNGRVNILRSGALRDRFFAEVQKEELVSYGTERPPGAHISQPEADYMVLDSLAERHFCVLQFQAQRLEALQLNGDHHYRVEFLYENGQV